MELQCCRTTTGPRWAVAGYFLPQSLTLSALLQIPARALRGVVEAAASKELLVDEAIDQPTLMPPVEPLHEIWAAGVTYLRSRDARMSESNTGDIYERVYHAERPELFFKATGLRAAGHGDPIRVRPDSAWNTPEPEAVLVVNRFAEIIGYCAGNDVSSRSIEGDNPLYLPQAKIYDGACALGPSIRLLEPTGWTHLLIGLEITRQGETAFRGSTSTEQMKRSPQELVEWLFRDLSFPYGAFLFTGTGLVPPDTFSLCPGDRVRVEVGGLVLENPVV